MSTPDAPWRGRRLHFIGVGGAGLSGYARAASALGAQVSGSDSSRSPYLERLAADGVLQAHVGHAEGNVPPGEDVEVIYSSAVPEQNVERLAARRRGLPERPRAELLGELTALRRTIAVAGTHGKTTTAAMLVHALRGAGGDPGWLIGGTPDAQLPNAAWRPGEWLVVEADESDRSMLELHVEVAVLTNVEHDHHATFASIAELREAFRGFLAAAQRAIVLREEPALLQLVPQDTSSLTVAAFAPPPFTLTPGGSSFRWRSAQVSLAVAGAHNVLNAIAALEAARLAGAGEELAARALSGFGGAGRRFELLGCSARGALIYDDYAHHPTEVAATLAAARTLGCARLVCAFQPHLYSRTALLAREFGRALAEADVIVVLDVYPARERADEHRGVSGLLIAEAAADAAAGKPVYWLPGFQQAEEVLHELLGVGDICVLMGAGDIDELGRALAVADVENTTAAGAGAKRR